MVFYCECMKTLTHHHAFCLQLKAEQSSDTVIGSYTLGFRTQQALETHTYASVVFHPVSQFIESIFDQY